ncbi:Protein kinase C signaling pathway involved MAPKK protein [Phlyctochytrium bullatum]|nr:Protein kinase C signaling pathway involved MAPKK protein [Phlyctochytrium bullatum]
MLGKGIDQTRYHHTNYNAPQPSAQPALAWKGTVNPNDITIQGLVTANLNCTIEKGVHQGLAVIVKRSTKKSLIEREISFLKRASNGEFIVSFGGWFEEVDLGIVGLVMQKCAMDLKDWSDEASRSPPSDLENKMLQISEGIAKGLAFINNLSIIHNDLKPRNIFVDKYSKPHIGDFGVATRCGEPLQGYTKQYFDKQSLNIIPDELSDSWLLGATLWEFWSDESFNVDEDVHLNHILLLDFGADHQRKDENGKLPIQLSTSVHVWRELASKMTRTSGNLFDATEKGDDIGARLILGTEENPPAILSQPKVVELHRSIKCTVMPLHVAAARGHVAVCQLLLQMGAEIDCRGNLKRTPLNWAAIEGHLPVIQLLCEKGADAECRNEYGYTPLHHAAFWGHVDIVRFLVERGAADIDCRTNLRDTPLHAAAFNGQLQIVQYLVQKGADVLATDKDGKTARDWALEKGHENVAEFLEMIERRISLELNKAA